MIGSTATAIPADLTEGAVEILTTADAGEKARRTLAHAAAWREGAISGLGSAVPPDRPARPARPELRPPREMPKRRLAGSEAGRVALLHAIAHIELNAIDLAWDISARFVEEDLPRAFYDDWVSVADDEARHFSLIEDRLAAFGASYGDLPAHDGLWQAAKATAHDLPARLAVVPMVLEARGLDVTPPMIERMRRFGDIETADALQIIFDEEIGHVAAGRHWFEWCCARDDVAPVETWRDLVARYFKGELKPPFNDAARAQAGLSAEYYR